MTVKYAPGMIFVLLWMAISHQAAAQEIQWTPITGKALGEFMSDLTIERVEPDGRVSRAVYSADGTGVLFKWGVKFSRKWELEGKDEVCFIYFKGRNCSRIEQNTTDPDLYRAYDQSQNQWIDFRVVGRSAEITGKPQRRENEGSAASPSASEVAAELTNPNTTLGILTTLYDYKTFDGSTPNASRQSAQSITFQPSLPYPLSEGRNLFSARHFR